MNPSPTMAHDVKYHHGGEVVCTCGGYFASDRVGYSITSLRTGLQKWAEHVKATNLGHAEVVAVADRRGRE